MPKLTFPFWLSKGSGRPELQTPKVQISPCFCTATNLHIVHLAIKVTKSRLALLDSSCSEYIHIVHVCTCRFMTTLLRTKRRLYVRPTATWRDEVRALYGNFLSFYFSLITPGSHLVYLPELIANYILNYF